MRKILFIISLLLPGSVFANITFQSGEKQSIVISSSEEYFVHSALQMFMQDYAMVFDSEIEITAGEGNILIGILGLKSRAESLLSRQVKEELSLHNEAFLLEVVGEKLIILGSDKRERRMESWSSQD